MVSSVQSYLASVEDYGVSESSGNLLRIRLNCTDENEVNKGV